MYSKLFPFLRTVDDRNRLVTIVKQLQNERFKVGHLSQGDDVDLRKILAELLADDPTHKSAELLLFLDTLPLVRMTLAFTPDPQQIEEYAQILRHDDSVPYLLQIETDDRIIAGVQLVREGKMFDASLRTKLTAFFSSEDYRTLVANSISS